MLKIETEVNVFDVTFNVIGYYYPEEPTVWYDNNMEGYPGAPADFEIESVKIEEIEVKDIISDQVYELIIEQVIEKQL